MIDNFGRTVTITRNGNGTSTYSVGGLSVVATLDAAAMNSLNAMAPGIFTAPITQVSPYDFIALFTKAESDATYASVDTTIKGGIVALTSLIGLVDLEADETINLIGYLVYVGILTQARAAQILSGTPHGQ